MSQRVEPEPSDKITDTLVASSEATAAVVAAVEEWLASATTSARERAAESGRGATSTWRFSGRNWSGPVSLRRDRPRR